MNELDIIREFLEERREALLLSQREKGMYASGKSARETRVEMTDTGGKMIGPDYWKFQEDGRGPGRFSPIDEIREWIRIKGQPLYGIPETAAFAIARKHAQEGSKAYREGGTQVISDVINQKEVNKLLEKVGATILNTVASDVLKTWKSK